MTGKRTTLIGVLMYIISVGIRTAASATCARPSEDFVVFNGRWYIQPSAAKSQFAAVNCPSGSRMATAQNEDDYKAILHFYQTNGAEMWVGFKDPSGRVACTNEGCNNLIEWVDGTKFTYQSFMTEGIEVKSGADCFALFDSGKIVGETGCQGRTYSYLCQSECQGAYPPCSESPPSVGGSTKRTYNWDQTTKDYQTVIRYPSNGDVVLIFPYTVHAMSPTKGPTQLLDACATQVAGREGLYFDIDFRAFFR